MLFLGPEGGAKWFSSREYILKTREMLNTLVLLEKRSLAYLLLIGCSYECK